LPEINGKKIRLNEDVRLRDVKDDPLIFFDLRTYRLVIIPAVEGSIEKKILRLVASEIKKGSTLNCLMDLASEKFGLSQSEARDGLADLLRTLIQTNMLKVES
jgi:hypothetical protein